MKTKRKRDLGPAPNKENKDKVLDVLADLGTASAKEVSAKVGLAYSTVTGLLRSLLGDGKVTRVAIDGEDTKEFPGSRGAVYQILVKPTPSAKRTRSDAPAPKTGRTRQQTDASTDKPPRTTKTGVTFGRGELRGTVLARLVNDHNTYGDASAMTPTELSKLIPGSQVGSVAFACEVLVQHEQAVLKSTKPKKYQATV